MHEISGAALWPAVRALLVWGDEYYAPAGPRRVFQHAADEAPLDELGPVHRVRCGARARRHTGRAGFGASCAVLR
jgi:hypothetical protein